MYNNEKVSFEKIYLNYLTLLILSTFLKCSQYTSVRNGLAFWKRDLTTKILRFANTCTICGEFNKKKIFGSLLLKYTVCRTFANVLMMIV